MGKKKKCLASTVRNPLGMPTVLPPSNPQINCGGYMDDDFDDFLPAAWKSENKPTATSTSPPKPETIPQQSTMSLLARDIVELQGLTLNGDVTTPLRGIANPFSESTNSTLKSKAPTIKLDSRKNGAKNDYPSLEAQVKALKDELKAKDKMLEAANERAQDVEKKLQCIEKNHQFDLKLLRCRLQNEHKYELHEYQEAYKEIEAEREKATTDLRLLRERHQDVKAKFKGYKKKVYDENTRLEVMAGQAYTYKMERDQNASIIELMRTDAADAARRYTNIHAQLTQTRAMELKLRNYRIQLDSENHELKLKLRKNNLSEGSVRNSDFRDLRRKYDKLKDILEDSERDYRVLQDDYDEVKGRMRELQTNLSRKSEKLAALKVKYADQTGNVEDLGKRITELEDERRSKEPLTKVGTEIRLRFLEFAREIAQNTPRAQLDLGIISNGNSAAHRANGKADAALFEFGFVPDDSFENGRSIFKALYQCEPYKYNEWGPASARLLDCRATIMTLKPIHECHESREKRLEHTRVDTLLCGMFVDGACAGNNNDDKEEAKALIKTLEELTDQIVQMERSRGFRRRG